MLEFFYKIQAWRTHATVIVILVNLNKPKIAIFGYHFEFLYVLSWSIILSKLFWSRYWILSLIIIKLSDKLCFLHAKTRIIRNLRINILRYITINLFSRHFGCHTDYFKGVNLKHAAYKILSLLYIYIYIYIYI